MAGIRKQNLILVIAVLLAALFLHFFVCPYLEMIGARKGACIALYAVLLLFYIYMRANRPVVRRPRTPPNPGP
jgi:hypothetical protein